MICFHPKVTKLTFDVSRLLATSVISPIHEGLVESYETLLKGGGG